MIENAFTSRLKRYTQVTTTMGGLMARLLGDRYLGLSLDPSQHSLDLKDTLGTLKGPLMKIAQILATVPDMLPPEYAEAFLELQSNAPPMGWPFVRRRMQAELGPNWQSQFLEFEKEACAAASLGQVHKARDHEGRLLAVKLQYPEMGAAVEADLAQLKIILKSFELYSSALDTENLHKEITERLWEELDYQKEAQHIEIFRNILDPLPFVRVPEVSSPLTTSRLLSMTWLTGDKILTFKEAPQDLRNKIASGLFKAWYFPLYHAGFLHGDPHLGNYSWSQQGELNLLDFGCVRVFKASFIRGILDLYRALQTNDEELAVQAYMSWGFTTLDKELIHILNLWARFLYDPLLEDRIRPIEETHSGLRGRQIVGEILTQLGKKGGIKPPQEFVFMDRTAVGLGSVCMHLRAELNWHQLFEEIIQDFSETALEKHQHFFLRQEIPYKKS